MQPSSSASEFGNEIAIVGMACILPGGVDSPEALWKLLCESRDAITEVPSTRWNVDTFYDPNPGTPGKSSTRWGGFVDNIDGFDAAFFGISPREAAVMDPQQRMLLETAWRALEDGGIPVSQLVGSQTGVYVGISHSDYHGIQKFGRHEIDVHTSTGGALSIAANRLSHRFDLRGPSLSIDTACSSSLVALDIACSALRTGECEMALVGGVNAILTPDVTITFSRASMLSPDGRCKAFDSRANGYVRGEGAGMVVLKPLARALADGDKIHAVIKATAVNQDGRTTTITVPSLPAQVAMLRDACRRAKIDPGHVGYVEAHGTGTPVGDPIEAEAIGTVFGARRGGRRPCVIGSIKTNIGHLEPAAGVIGLMKAVLCVENAQIPPNLHFQSVNPRIRLDDLGLEVCQKLIDFPNGKGPRVAAVNSFGFGGTNACAIVQQPPAPTAARPPAVRNQHFPILLPHSAANKKALETQATQLVDLIDTETRLRDAAGTLALRRSHLDHRAMVIARSREEACDRLRAIARSEQMQGTIYGRRMVDPRIAFVFTGQGAQWWRMGRDLLEHDRIFRGAVEQCDAVFQKLSGWSLIEQLTRSQEDSRMDQTVVAQPATFALQVGLAALWKEWGIRPSLVIGHSIGEMAAAYTAGALSLDDAIRVVYHRSRLQELARFQGGMAAVGLAAEEAGRFLHQEQFALEIAAVNSGDLVTIAGAKDELDRLLAHFETKRSDVFARKLRVDYAFHTRQMDPFEDELRRNLEPILSHLSEVTMISTVTGNAVRAGELNADYWWRNMREPVLFHAAVESAINQGCNTFVEIGAHPVLAGPVRSSLALRGATGVVVASLSRDRSDEDSLGDALGQLYANGVDPAWQSIAPAGWTFLPLPRHPFEKSSCWAESEEARDARFEHPAHPLLGFRLRTAAPVWQAHINADMPRYLGDHRVDGTVVFPAAGYVELCLAAAREALGPGLWELESIAFHDALLLNSTGVVVVQTSFDPGQGKVDILSRERNQDGGWTRRASARIRTWSGRLPRLNAWQPTIEPPALFEQTRFYRQLKNEGHGFGPAFQGVRTLWREHAQTLGLIKLPPEAGSGVGYLLHPSILDGCFQVIRGFRDIQDSANSDRMLALPISIDRMRYFRAPGEIVYSRATAVEDDADVIKADISIVSEVGEVVAVIEGFCCQKVNTAKDRTAAAGASLYRERWIECPRTEADPGAAAFNLKDQTWLLLADRGGTAEEIARRLRAHGAAPVLAFHAHESRRVADGIVEIAPDTEGLAKVLIELTPPACNIVDFWPLDAGMVVPDCSDLASAQRIGAEALIALTQAIDTRPDIPKVQVVTRCAVAPDPSHPGAAVLQAAVQGIARTLANERPELALRTIDIDSETATLDALFSELTAPDEETEIALRAQARHACRIERVGGDQLRFRRVGWTPETRSPPFTVTMTSPGVIDNLIMREIRPLDPGPGEALIEVHAAGLNFRDVMAATGLLPAEAEAEPAWQHLGFECAGIVRAVGPDADPALVGKRVVAVSSGCFASQIAVNTALVFPIPDRFSFTEAAAVPTAYVTAQYSLVTLGRIRRGDRVLIHAAAGGVGLAAVAIARKHGAEIIATVGSPEKRDFLRERGVQHIFDSRSLGFADDVMAVTEGYGVDIVLNSLPGPFLEKSLSLLAPGGRFLEIGKRDIYADTPIGLRTFRKNISFFAVDLARLALERPDFLREEIETVLDDLDQGRTALLPITEFPVDKVADAFRHMAKARQIGKIVLSYESPLPVDSTGSADELIRPDATYLVTGGLGGFGLAIARWLVERGARSLVLVGRSGTSRAEAVAALQEMREKGADILALAADVSDRQQVVELMARIGKLDRPLRGVIHAAGVIDDALVADLDVQRIHRVFEPKALGAWNLHEVTRHRPLDFFVMLSSVASVIGSVGQAHYAGANRTLDAIAAFRESQGLPALSIAWGAIAEAGFLSRRQDVARYLEQTGVRPIPLDEALRALGTLIGRACSTIVCADVNWATLGRSIPSAAGTLRLSELTKSQTAEDGKSGHYLRTRLLALPENARLAFAEGFVREQVGLVLKVSAQTIELDRPLAELGLDSLTSFELKNRVETELGASLPIGKFLQRPTPRDLAAVILERLDAPLADAEDAASSGGTGSEPAISIGQEALWFVDRIAPGSPAYSLAMCISLRPKVDPQRLDAALQLVVARHDSLRLSFPADSTGPVPTFLDPTLFRLAVHEAALWEEHTLRRHLDDEANRAFDLGEGPLLRLHLYRRSEQDILLLQVHHIVADAASIAISVEQMLEAYFALEAGVPVRWSRPALPVASYVSWQRTMLDSPAGKAHLEFWRGQLAGLPAALGVPLDLPRPPSQRGAGAARNLTIPKELGRKLKDLARREGQTLFAVLLTAFNLLLHRLSGDNDIVVGTPTLGRLRAEFADAVGYYVNPVPIRTQVQASDTFKKVLTRVSSTVNTALEHQEFPFARIVRDLEITRDPSRSPVFQVMFAMERSAEIDAHGFAATLLNTEGASIAIRGYKIEAVAVRRDRAQFDLTFVIEEFGDSIFGVIDYRTDLWQPATIERMSAQYRAILEAVAETPDTAITDIKIGQDCGHALVGRSLDHYPDVFDAIRSAAVKYPGDVAVECNGVCWTYRQLLERASAIAGALAARGIGRQSLVTISMTRSAEMLAALLGVLQVGAAYAPLDLAHPAERLRRILADARSALILTDETGAGIMSALTADPLLTVASITAPNAPGYVHFGKDGYQESELAYVIHTSGSTGGPIGVEVRRRSVSNFLAAMSAELPISSDDSLLAVTTISFDIAVLELLLPLTVGARVIIADDNTARDGRQLAARLAKNDISIMQATPATWQMIIDAGWKGRSTFKALVGGEKLQRSLANAILERAGELRNLYGPTETTVWSTIAQVFSEPTTASIGRPILNTTCYVVDENFNPVPVGVPGELLIGGHGVARGYRNNPERTAARFIADPFDPSGTSRCFRTGDFVRVSQEGTLEFIGRRDQQVKVRGFRVELAEIEAALSAQVGVKEGAAVIQGSDLAHARVIAFAALQRDAKTDQENLTAALKRSLPPYMVPNHIAIVDALPRLPNGKIDRTRLASMPAAPSVANRAFVKPQTPTEIRLTAILQEVLGLDRVSADDDFFAVGGTSLLAVRYLARVSEVFQTSIAPVDLLRAPTVAELAKLIDRGMLSGGIVLEAPPVVTSASGPLWRPLAMARAEGQFGAVDAAAIAYLPDELMSIPGSRSQLARLGETGSGGFWTGVCHLPYGTIALVVAPIGGRDLFADYDATRAVIGRSVDYAARLGARCIALTGMIPAATDLGLTLRAPEGVSLTTGHSATAASMALTIAAVAAATERNLRDETMSFIGLGAIGTATLQTMMSRVAHPRALTLCDVPAKRAYLESLAHEVRVRHQFRGEIHIATTTGRLPDKAYQASFFVGATNVPDVIDIERLSPGSIVVDDSFPLCFDLQKAGQRFDTAADIICVAGGSVALQEPIHWHLALPPGISALGLAGRATALFPSSNTITGCILSSLMPASGLHPTLGTVSLADCEIYWDGFARLGIKAAPLHCGPSILTTKDLYRFRSHLAAIDPRTAIHSQAASAAGRAEL